jgi:hypothetical protein
MKKVMLNSVRFLILFSVIVFLLNSCTEEFDYGKSENAVKTEEYSNVLQTEATVSGIVNTDNGSALIERGICYAIHNNPTIENSKKTDNVTSLGNFSYRLDNLEPSTTYHAKAYAINSYGTAYGTEISFTTKEATIPILSSTTEVNSIAATSAKTGGVISNSGASKVTSSGICYSSTVAIPTIQDSKTTDGSTIGEFVSALTVLTPNTTYYVRAYATNAIGTGYGSVKTFTTTIATTPTGITTIDLTFITQNSAVGGGSIVGDGGSAITSRGVCWSNTTSIPTIVNSKTVDGTGIGTFSSSLSGLIAGITYYVRAYATNSKGTAYGIVKSVTTVAATIPTGISTNTLSSITQTTATGGGNISSDGGASITSRGVCWSTTTSSPTTLNSKTIDGNGIGLFTSSLTGLTANTIYYVRSYATNSAGTAYGATQTFITSAVTIPTGATTTSISSISQTTALSGGSITSDGGAMVTSRGVCWSSSNSSPTTSNTKTIDGSGIGSFTSSLTGLAANTNYYVRSYATNSAGTVYGTVRSFTTLPPALAVGQSHQGGIIAYIFQSGDSGYISGETHGLIATTSNQSTGVQWGCSGTGIGTSTSLGTGQSNTTAIVTSCSTTNIAARMCNDLNLGGYSDWYLPSYYELEKLYINKAVIGAFSNVSYWSSSQSSSTTTYSINFSNGTTAGITKTSLIYVRAIRKF